LKKEKYHIFIDNVCVYPQCYAAAIDRIDKFPEKQLVVDIGSWTVDIMPIINHLPDESVCVTQPHGIITCIQQINKECVRQLNAEVDEYDIQKIMANGGGDLPKKATLLSSLSN
jgi:plasmid segregation protein ParM